MSWLHDVAAWHQTPETSSDVIVLKKCAAQAYFQKYILVHIMAHPIGYYYR